MGQNARTASSIGFDPTSGRPCQSACKRFLDVSIALAGLFLLAPLMLTLIIFIKLRDPGPALYTQVRVGLNGRRFRCLKFRSMVMDSEKALREHLDRDTQARAEWDALHKLKNDPRVTAIGRFLRRSSLDELPQLLNVIVGDMSLVGPRPVIPDELPRYGDKLIHYLSVRPGLTGLWQVSGRSNCTYPERVALDAQYVEEWKLSSDLVILLRTIPAVLAQRGSQ